MAMSQKNQDLIQKKIIYENGKTFVGFCNQQKQPKDGTMKWADRVFVGIFKDGYPFYGKWFGGGPLQKSEQ
jgi:hypothetical protein